MELNSQGGPRFEDQEGWPTLLHAQHTCLPEVLTLSCNCVEGELLGGHAANSISIYVACRCPSCFSRTTKVGLPNPSSGKKSGIPSGGTRSRQANLGSTSSGRAKASGSSGGQPRSPPPQPVPGPLFNLEDWFVHCHATEPDWKLPNDLLSPKKAEKLVKRSIMVLQTMGSTAGSSSPGGGGGQGNQVLLGDWIAAFAMRYRGSARSSLVNQSVQVLWWNDPCDPRQDSNHPFLYGTWYAGKTLSVNYKTGHLKVRYTDGEEHEVAMGVNFVHFGEKHPTGNEPARLPPLPPAVQPSQQAVEAGLKAGLAASGADGSSGRRRGRSTGSSGGARQAGGPGSVCSIDPGGRQGSAVASLFIEATETGAHGKVPKPGAVKAEAVAETGAVAGFISKARGAQQSRGAATAAGGGSGGDGGVGGSNALQAPPPSGPSARPSLGGAWPQKRPKLATVETVNGSNASADGSGRDSVSAPQGGGCGIAATGCAGQTSPGALQAMVPSKVDAAARRGGQAPGKKITLRKVGQTTEPLAGAAGGNSGSGLDQATACCAIPATAAALVGTTVPVAAGAAGDSKRLCETYSSQSNAPPMKSGEAVSQSAMLGGSPLQSAAQPRSSPLKVRPWAPKGRSSVPSSGPSSWGPPGPSVASVPGPAHTVEHSTIVPTTETATAALTVPAAATSVPGTSAAPAPSAATITVDATAPLGNAPESVQPTASTALPARPAGRTALGPEDQTHRKPREQAQPPLPPHAASIAAKGENGGVQSSSGRDAKRRRIGSLTWNPRASSKGFSGPAQSTASRSGLAPNDGTGLFLRTTPEQKVSALSGAADTAVPLAMVTVDETSSRTTVAAAATEVVVVVRVAPSQSGQPSHQEQHTSDGKVDTSMAESPGAEMQPAEGVPPGSGPAGRLRLGGHVELDCGAHEGSTEAERPTDGGVEPSGQAEAAGDGQATEAVMGIGGGASSARYAASGSAAGDEPGAGGADSDAGAAHNGGIHLGMVTELDEPGKQGPFGGPAEGQEEGGAAGAADAGHPTSGCDVVAGGVQDGCVAGAPGGGSCSADGTVVARCNSARRGGNPTVDIESRGRRPERLAAGGSSAVAVTEAAPATATGITVQALTVTMAMAEAAVAGIMETAQAPGGPAASRGKEHVYAAASEATSAISTGEGACATAAAAGGPALEAKAVTANPAIDVTTAPGDMDIAKDDGHGLEHTAWQPDLAPCSAAPVSSSEAALVAGSDGTIPVLVSGSHPLQVDPSLGHEGAVLCSALVVGPGDDATQNQSQKVATKGDVGDGKGGAGAGAAGPECDTGRDASAAGGAVTNANLRGVEAQALALAPPASTASAADAANGAMAVAGVEAATAPGNEAEAMASGVACGAGRGSGDAVAAVIPLDTSDTAVTLSLALGAAADTSGGGGDDVGGHGSGADSSNKNAAAGIGAGGAGVGAGSSHDRDTGITAEEGVTGYGIGPGSSGDGMAARVPPPSSVEEHEAGAASGMDGHAAVAHRGDRRTGEHLDLTSEAALPVGPMGRIPDGATIDTGSANAVDRIPCALPPELAPPPELPDAVVQEWLAWWFVASSVGYARQAAQVLSLARQAAAGLRVNFTAIIEDSCRRLGCYPLHLRVLQVHFIQHAYVSFHRVAPELGAKLANQLLMLMKLFINEATLEQQERDMAGAAAPSATATLPPAQPPVLLPSGSNTGGGCGIGGRRATGSVGGASTGGSAAGPGIAQPGMPPAATSPHQQQERGLTVEEFWQVVAMCGSHCVQLVIIAMQCERAGKPIPKEVHDRLPDFAELLRWAAAAAPIRPAPASSPTGQRQFDILRRFNVTVIRIVRRLHASAEGNQQRASSGSRAAASGQLGSSGSPALSAVPSVPQLQSQLPSDQGHNQHQVQQQWQQQHLHMQLIRSHQQGWLQQQPTQGQQQQQRQGQQQDLLQHLLQRQQRQQQQQQQHQHQLQQQLQLQQQQQLQQQVQLQQQQQLQQLQLQQQQQQLQQQQRQWQQQKQQQLSQHHLPQQQLSQQQELQQLQAGETGGGIPSIPGLYPEPANGPVQGTPEPLHCETYPQQLTQGPADQRWHSPGRTIQGWRIGVRQLYMQLKRAGSRREPSAISSSGSDSESQHASDATGSVGPPAGLTPASGSYKLEGYVCQQPLAEQQQQQQQQQQHPLAIASAVVDEGGGTDEQAAAHLGHAGGGDRREGPSGSSLQKPAIPMATAAGADGAVAAPAGASPWRKCTALRIDAGVLRATRCAIFFGSKWLDEACTAAAAVTAGCARQGTAGPQQHCLEPGPPSVPVQALEPAPVAKALATEVAAAAAAATTGGDQIVGLRLPHTNPVACRADGDTTGVAGAAAAAVGAADAEVAGAGAGVEDVADATVLPDPAAVPCMGAGWLDTSVRALITRHVRAHRPSPGSGQEEGTRQPASAAADTAAGGCITPCPDTGIASATAPSTSVARTAEEGEKEDRATGCAKRLGRVMAAWGALPPAQQRALYLVSCRMARDLNGVGNWWAVEMAVETLETLAEAAEKRRVIPDVESAGCADGAGGVEPTH